MTPSSIASSLSEAQRLCILAMSDKYRRAKAIPAAGSTLHSLWDFKRDCSTSDGACAPPVAMVTRDYQEFPLCWVWKLTPLGLAVRATLKGER